MSKPVRDLLLDYLTGALDEPEHRRIERRVLRSRRLRRELAELRRTFAPLEETRRPIAAPPGLAERTSQYVFSQVELLADDSAAQQPATDRATNATYATGAVDPTEPPAPRQAVPLALAGAATAGAPAAENSGADAAAVPAAAGGGVSLFDVVTVGGILVALGALLVPAVYQSRMHARLLRCQDNLRQVGMALSSYSQQHGDLFPVVPAEGNLAAAGVYAPMLLETGYLDAARRVICPDDPSPAAKAEDLPTLAQLRTAEGHRLGQLQRRAGGSYGYSLGHLSDGVYRGTRNRARPYFALMADAPNAGLPDRQSANHGGEGQNVLFEDGRVDFVSVPIVRSRNDHVFFNDDGQIAAGTHPDDAVLATGAVTPLPPPSPQDR